MLLQQVARRAFSQGTKLRVPSIRFRHGTRSAEETAGSGVAAAASGAQQQAAVIYDFQVPTRYRRAVMYEDEINYINNGGPM